MPLQPNLFERFIFLTANQGPGPMLDLLGALSFKAVKAALDLGVFEALKGEPLSVRELAERIGADSGRLGFLLEALEPLGYVGRQGDRFCNTAMTERWMLDGGQAPLGDLFLYFDDIDDRWGGLAESIRRGEPAADPSEWARSHPGAWERYHAGMRAIAFMLIPELIAKLQIPPDARRLLDLGGSHGLYSAALCKRYPELHATVLDVAHARGTAEATIDKEGLEGRLEFREGDFLTDDLGEGYDVVLLFNVARAFREEALKLLFSKIIEALRPSGVLVILDQLVTRPPTRLLRANASLINLELVTATRGTIHSPSSLAPILVRAGFAPPEQFPLRRSGGQGVVVATRPPS